MATREAVLHPAYSIRTITKMSICVALCCVSAYISIPLPFTTAMITALTVVMNLTAFILKPKQTLIVMLVWILLGSAGLPVFVGGTAGFGRLFGPTGGFIIAFAIAYPPCQLVKRPEKFLYTLFSYCSHHRDPHHVSGRSHFYDAGTAGNVLAGLCHGRIPIYSRRYCQSCPGCVFRGADQYALSRLTILYTKDCV